ncbi:M14 family zinc carboxypeptidase [Neobacillus jeddahensis]|uniref:M14 family zinc carboxypeptidase n=1 Tax=Neobacillus jeddahensis TaxID=1461580 RepID=UPI00058E6AA1|nr:M14 family zinc carboxypeptidase [Neobacillus jeddahensis]
MTKYVCHLLFVFCLFEPVKAHGEIVTGDKLYSVELLEHDLKLIQTKYQQQVIVKSIGTSHFGQPIWAAKLGKGKKNIVIIGSHHGREWMTSTLVMKMLETYADDYKEGRIWPRSTKILDEVSIWFVPMLNPDGVSIQQNRIDTLPIKQQRQLVGMNKGQTNFKRWKANGIGIDLNRQYPAGWSSLEKVPKVPSYQFYKGKKPLEAMEVIAITNFIKDINPSIAVAYHTAGREIFWNYKNGNHLQRDRKVAKKMAKLTHYKLARPPKEATGGGFTDWFITTYHRPALTIEISYLVGETSPPLSVFKEEWKRNRYVGLKLAKEAKKIPVHTHNSKGDGENN